MSVPILVVEDDRDIRAGLKEILEVEGYVVQCASDGAAALELLARGPLPRIILLDVMMPGMGGLDFRRQQLAHPEFQGIPVIALTADARIADRARELKADGAVRKPFALDDLLQTVESVLATRGAA